MEPNPHSGTPRKCPGWGEYQVREIPPDQGTWAPKGGTEGLNGEEGNGGPTRLPVLIPGNPPA